MACSKEELVDWLNCVPDDAAIAIDDGGLTLVSTGDQGEELYFEVGGIPEED